MGNAPSSVRRTCRSLWNFSTSTSLAREEEELTVEQRLVADQEERFKREQELRLLEERRKREVQDKVTNKVSLELQELRQTIELLSKDLQAPGGEFAPVSDDHKKQYSRMDDYVHETMYTLLMWLSTRPEFKVVTMGQLMFFLKSPHIRNRKKYILSVERILRAAGLSIFEKEQSAKATELASYFSLTDKRITQSKELKRLHEIEEQRSTWHALE